jgi:hypothetical protein
MHTYTCLYNEINCWGTCEKNKFGCDTYVQSHDCTIYISVSFQCLTHSTFTRYLNEWMNEWINVFTSCWDTWFVVSLVSTAGRLNQEMTQKSLNHQALTLRCSTGLQTWSPHFSKNKFLSFVCQSGTHAILFPLNGKACPWMFFLHSYEWWLWPLTSDPYVHRQIVLLLKPPCCPELLFGSVKEREGMVWSLTANS